MRRRIVLDASAAVHLICEFPAAAQMLEVLSDTATVMAPDLFATEVANALWKYVTHGTFDHDEAGGLLSEARSLVDLRVSDDELVEEALVAAITHGHPVYDMLYAVLARRNGAPVVTMDRRFAVVLEGMEIESLSA